MNIYVGKLPYSVTEDDLRAMFAEFGELESVKIIRDKNSKQSKGFGSVEMPVKIEVQAAIDGMNGKESKGRTINVNEARPRTEGRRNDANRSGGQRGRGRRF